MIGKPAQAPYLRYTVYKVFHEGEGRYYAVLVSKKHRTTITYGKYVLESSLGRRLKKGYVAHHKDEIKTNDALSNLEEKLKKEHDADHHRSPIRHGSATGYRRGCRCEGCRKGHQACCLKSRRKIQAQKAAVALLAA